MPSGPDGKTRLAGLVGGTAAAGVLLTLVMGWEGKSNAPYRDIVGVWTVCYGETKVAMRRYTDAQCEDMLADSLVGYVEPVLARNPELRGHPNQLIAAASLTYNVGAANYRRSSVARLFSAGRWREACGRFRDWRFAGGREVRGLARRRAAETAICLRGLP